MCVMILNASALNYVIVVGFKFYVSVSHVNESKSGFDIVQNATNVYF